MAPFQLTLAILKPDVLAMPISVAFVREAILKNRFLLVRSKTMHLSKTKAEAFYKEHDGKFFYNRLVTFMSSGPIDVYILAKNGAIKDWRQLIGPTKVFKTRYEASDTLRGQIGLTDTRNSLHGSDSEETATNEISFFFPEFCHHSFEKEEKSHFQRGTVALDRLEFIHKPLSDCSVH